MSKAQQATTHKQEHNSFTDLRQGVIDVLPLSIAVIPWGILCGSLAIEAGLSPLQAQLMSLLVFAGAAQLASIAILGAGGSATAIFSSTFVISSRHLLYSAVFRERVEQAPFLQRVSLAFFLTDEMFAVTIAFIEKHRRFSMVYAFASGVCFYLVWNMATYLGIAMGQHLSDLKSLGLEFAIAATFIAIVIPAIKDKSTLFSVIASGGSVITLTWLEVEQGLIIATLVGMVIGYCHWRKEQKRG